MTHYGRFYGEREGTYRTDDRVYHARFRGPQTPPPAAVNEYYRSARERRATSSITTWSQPVATQVSGKKTPSNTAASTTA